MAEISEEIRKKLKRPLGKLHRDFRKVVELSKDHRIITVGDICTLGLLGMGIRPHLAIYDFRYMRDSLPEEFKSILESSFNETANYKNPAGTLSDRILADAGKLLSKGGAVVVDGEEDLTALAFILEAGENDIIIYGQPNSGIVIVMPDARLKRKIRGWLSD